MEGTSPLWSRIDQQAVRDLAVVGVSKHAGKTTAFVRLIEDAHQEGRRLALASVGIDGERADSILGIPKPPIFVPMGARFATAIGMRQDEPSKIAWLEPTGISSPFGEVWLAEATGPCRIVLAGVRQLVHLCQLRARFHELGADHVLFDGALSRMIAMHPDVSDGVILSTGAVVGSLSEVIRATRLALQKIGIDKIPPSLEWFVKETDPSAGAVVGACEDISLSEGDACRQWHLYDLRVSETATAFTEDVRAVTDLSPDHRIFYFGGAVTDRVLESLQGRTKPVMVIARSPAHVFLSEGVWRRFLRAGNVVRVVRRTPLIAVTVNPVSPRGPDLNRSELMEAVQTLTTVPVWDVME